VQRRVDTVKKENRKSVLMLIQRQDGLQWVPLSIGSDKDKQPGAEEKAPEKPKAPVVKKDPLTQDAQLSAALLMLRLQLAGAQI